MLGENYTTIYTDVLVVGGGGAALRAAIEAARNDVTVTIVVKSKLMEGGSTACGISEIKAIAAALGSAKGMDNPKAHYEDTIKAGKGTCNEELVRILCEEAPQRVYELAEWGVPFIKDKEGKIAQWKSDHATYPRTCRCKGDTAKNILRVLIDKVRKSGCKIIENTMVHRLLAENGTVIGAIGIDIFTGEFIIFQSKSTIIASGGAGSVYSHNVYTPEMSGDGYAMAYEIGADLVNMEFIQMGPGLLFPPIILSGPFYSLNPKLINTYSKEFLSKYLPREITSDEVFRQKVFPFTSSNISKYIDIAIQKESSCHEKVYYDISHIPEKTIMSTIPLTYTILKERGINLREHRAQIGIVVQCFNGGIRINEKCETTIAGLYACGEIAGGVRGADRPGGNSLAEGQVFGARAGKFASERAKKTKFYSLTKRNAQKKINQIKEFLCSRKNSYLYLNNIKNKLQEAMHKNALIIRNKENLESALSELNFMEKETLHSLCVRKQELVGVLNLINSLVTGKMILKAALLRNETRGSHYREDFPSTSNNWGKCIVITKGKNNMELATMPASKLALF